MLPLRRARQRVGFSPGDTVEKLRQYPGDAALEVILSNHLVRYTVLPWSSALSTDKDWMAYAEHIFASTYGADAAGWRIRICDTGRRKTRVACAAEVSLLDSIAGIPRVVSIQPHLMAAFNARRSEFDKDPGWFVVHERGRLTLGLVAGGEWKLLRNRAAREDWRETLPELIQRETAASGETACERVVLSTGLA